MFYRRETSHCKRETIERLEQGEERSLFNEDYDLLGELVKGKNP
jgi:hypothetical protein